MALNQKIKIWCAVGALLGAAATSANAGLASDEIARLGKDLTPVGAERAGNKEGTIPAWEGGLQKIPANFDPRKGYADPFAEEKPLYSITAANFQQYKDKLAPGQVELLKRYPTYKINVYPSHRTAALPQSEYDAIRDEAGQAQLAPGGDGVVNVSKSSVPFPIPKAPLEAYWNIPFRYRGGSLTRYVTEFPVQSNGAFTPVKRTEWMIWPPFVAGAEPNRGVYYLNIITGPSSMAGESVLLHESIDYTKDGRRAWSYNPGQRRVLRAPEIAYDNPGQGADGLRGTDDYDGISGRPDRYDWKLLGKREMIIPYNNYKLTDKSLKYKDIVGQTNLNQDLVRYELHRVWVLEGSLKQGARHMYAKRVLFIDEDTWQVAHADQYDGRGELWRPHELYTVYFYDAKNTWIAGDSQYDLQARRYLVMGLTNEEKPIKFGEKFELSKFSPDNLRRVSE